MRQNVSPNKTLNMLTQERGLEDSRFCDHIAGKIEAHEIFVTGDVCGRGRIDVDYANRAQTEPRRETLAHDTGSCASVDHPHSRNRSGHGRARSPEGRFNRRSH